MITAKRLTAWEAFMRYVTLEYYSISVMLLKSFRSKLMAAALGLATVLGMSSNATAQDRTPGWWDSPSRLTALIGGGWNTNMAHGHYKEGGQEGQTNGTYATPEFHAGLEIPLAHAFMFVPRIAYNDYSNVLDDNSTDFKPFTDLNPTDPANNRTDKVAYAYRTVGMDLLFKWAFMDQLHLLIGGNGGASVKRSIAVGADNVEAASASQVEMPNAPEFFYSVGAGLGYDIPLTLKRDLWITPEVFYSLGLADLSQDYGNSTGSRLNSNTLGVRASLKFDVSPQEAIVQPVVVDLGASINARGVLPDGSFAAEPIVPQQTVHSRTSTPLLPYVFFDMGKSDIPGRYNRQGNTGFSTASLKGKEADEVNHSLLDIVGMRLKENASSSIRITGTNSNSGAEKGNINLSKGRAMAVRDYLVNTWGIDAGRITIDQRNLPELPTNPVTQPGMEENRRAEIASTDARITAPVKIESRDAIAVGETVIRFETSVRPPQHPFSSWTITVDQNGTQVGETLRGSGAPPAATTMTIPGGEKLIGQPLHYTLNVVDANGQTVKADGMTRVVAKTVDRDNLERYAMLSFDFDRAEINGRARQMLELIGESISRSAKGVAVNGYTDNTGTDEYNQALSEARATSAASTLREVSTLPANVSVKGFGETSPKFTNDLPEGRQLNRRVEITVEK